MPDVFAEAYPDKPDVKTTPIKIWGVTIDPSKPEDARVSVVLVKFLRARFGLHHAYSYEQIDIWGGISLGI